MGRARLDRRPPRTAPAPRGFRKALVVLERGTKEAIWDCRMCGQCILHSTGLSCPMRCPKDLRNGPCGGTLQDGHCEVVPEMKCVWVSAWEGSRKLPLWRDHIRHVGTTGRLAVAGTGSWENFVTRRDRHVPGGWSAAGRRAAARERTGARSGLHRLLQAGEFVVTAELATIDSADPAAVGGAVATLRGSVDAVNCTDNSAAHTHLSPLAAARLLIDDGVEPILQLACRDRNRLALQADLLGAAALGVRNIVCMTGDDVTAGDHPEAKPIFDIDAVHLLQIARIMRDDGRYLSGRLLSASAEYLIGAVENPFAPPSISVRCAWARRSRPAPNSSKRRSASTSTSSGCSWLGAVSSASWSSRGSSSGCSSRPPRAACRYLRDQVPGIDVPPSVIERMDRRRAGTT